MSARLSAAKSPGFQQPERPGGELSLVRKGDPDCVLIGGDNLTSLRLLQQEPTRFALAYLDPPFLTGREHAHQKR
jgi:hypothetical protein